jgi:ABC-type polysaccharide/polyol phosphate transport system ATPase subunit
LWNTVSQRPGVDGLWALRDFDLNVSRGESIGIVGLNGSGKSTLLQLICGTVHPTTGSLSVHGRIVAMLELGAGFNPDFTGRENALLSGIAYGLESSTVQARMQRIAAFADIGDYFDRPVREYSSGMYVRLAFAVCANVDADILVVDEVLSVGDAHFQNKCRRFITEFVKEATVLFVSPIPGWSARFAHGPSCLNKVGRPLTVPWIWSWTFIPDLQSAMVHWSLGIHWRDRSIRKRSGNMPFGWRPILILSGA